MVDPHDPVKFERARAAAERKGKVDEAIKALGYLARYPSQSTPAEIRDAATKAIAVLRPASSDPFSVPLFGDDGQASDAVAGT